MLIKFELSMPDIGSWNGRWSGENNLYAKVISFKGKAREKIAQEITEIGDFYYNFGDGWSANINVEKIDSKETAKVKRKSKGFYGYEWMIDSIIKNKKIIKP